MATDLKWATINDFRPGIFNKSAEALGNNSLPAPLGAAQFTNTYRCYALPSGGLAPLPKMSTFFAGTNPGATYSSGPWCVGFQANGPVNPSGGAGNFPDELFISVEYLNTTPRRRRRHYRINAFRSPVTVDTLNSYDSAYATPVTQFWGMSFGVTRMNDVDPLLPGTPVVVFEWSEQPGEGGNSNIWAFPNPAAPTVTGLLNMDTRNGQIICHQGRVILLELAIYSHGGTANVPTNENISFSDPPNSVLIGSQDQVFMQETPNGIGAWGSISAGELFLVKNSGGAILVQGDVAYPTITRLPGVVACGQITSRAAATPAGLFYLVNDGGIYVWRGGDTSQCVSPQLESTSFPTNGKGDSLDILSPSMNGVQAHLECWHDWVLVSNNWLFDTIGGGWWQIDNQATRNIRWWSRGSHPNVMYGAPLSYVPATAVYSYDKTIPSTSYSWQGHPMVTGDTNRLLTVREIVLVAQGSGAVTVTFTLADGTTQTETFTITNTTQPQRLRVTTAAKSFSIVPRIVSDGSSNPAPIVYELAIGYEESTEAAAV